MVLTLTVSKGLGFRPCLLMVEAHQAGGCPTTSAPAVFFSGRLSPSPSAWLSHLCQGSLPFPPHLTSLLEHFVSRFPDVCSPSPDDFIKHAKHSSYSSGLPSACFLEQQLHTAEALIWSVCSGIPNISNSLVLHSKQYLFSECVCVQFNGASQWGQCDPPPSRAITIHGEH